MEFDYCLQSSYGDHDQEVKVMRQSDVDRHELNKEGGEDGDGDEEDDIFYAEIRRQILLLTADDEEEGLPESRNGSPNSWSSACKGVRGGCYPSGNFNGWDSERRGLSMPIWVSNLWRNGNGTGVFIPKINNSRRNHRLRRNMNHERMTKIYKPVENKSR
ncbi:hypothetical protein FNV43_RR26557 [Rhamnella rubrinervis]|uniref:Uncharacterized protein n=1 Tax=Rhamnella rubrinervis TaxID=2594499 RepID=A0A8K0DN77_9ROSA|nr:hypothetical protein FNV43_RR26557 [Rhamnella rubrinervis]